MPQTMATITPNAQRLAPDTANRFRARELEAGRSLADNAKRHELFGFAAGRLDRNLDEVLAGGNRGEPQVDLMRSTGGCRGHRNVRHLLTRTVQQDRRRLGTFAAGRI